MNELRAYVNSLIPKNLSKKRKALLFDEIESHILDKAEFYEEIGYSWKESVKKAIKDFGTEEEVKNGILNEFEALYHERTWWAIPAGIAVFAMNILAFWLDIWVSSADYNSDPDSGAAFTSFCMIFSLLAGMVFARIKNYRKLLVGLGIGSFVSAANFLWCFFPQAAFYAIGLNTAYLIDIVSPFALGSYFDLGAALYFYLSIILLFSCSLYCFITAHRIKSGKAKQIQKPGVKATAFATVFFIIAAVSCSILPKAQRYSDDYPEWFDEYNSHISEETGYIYDEINLNDDYNEVAARLTEYGWISIENYEETLDKLRLKQFRTELKNMNFDENDEVWFVPGNRIKGKYISGNGFVALQKDKNGYITKKAIGDVSKEMYNNGFSFIKNNNKDDNMELMISDFAYLKKGDREDAVLSKFGKIYGEICTKNTHIEDGSIITYYRIICRGIMHPEGYSLGDYESRRIELTFKDEYLTQGKMWWTDINTGDVLTRDIEN